MKKAIATVLTALGATVALAAPSQAATAPDTSFRLGYHVAHQGYFFVDSDGLKLQVPQRSVRMQKCQSASCRAHVFAFYAGMHRTWRTYSHKVWRSAEGLPACSSLADNNCVYSDGSPFDAVRVNHTSYFVQASTRP